MSKAKSGFSATVKRGAASWSYIYITLGFMLTLEAALIAFITPLTWPRNLITYLAASAITAHLWLFSGWFQNKLVGWKARYEDVSRGNGLGRTTAFIVAVVILAAGSWWCSL